MADYFTQFSFVIPLHDNAAQSYALALHHQARQAQQGDAPPEDFPKSLLPVLEDWWFETEADEVEGKPGLWLHSDCGGIDAVCAFTRHLLQKYHRAGRVAFEWSQDCSKPRLDAYGGGAAIVTARRIKTMNTSDWLRRNIR